MIRACALVGLGALFSALAAGQTPAAGPAFEVASVKLSKGPGRGSWDARDGRLTAIDSPLKGLICWAYDVPYDRLIGPDRLDSIFVDVVAKFDPKISADTLRLMLQNLLAERFKLAVHHEQKTSPVYALIVGKRGAKLNESTAQPKDDSRRTDANPVILTANRVTMTEFASRLRQRLPTNWLGMPLVDQTGLTGLYDVTLTWTMTRNRDDNVEPPALSLFDALEEQLGLRLQERKAPVDRVVVDHVDPVPSEN